MPPTCESVNMNLSGVMASMAMSAVRRAMPKKPNAPAAAISGAPVVFGATSLEGRLIFELAKPLTGHRITKYLCLIINDIITNSNNLIVELIKAILTHRHICERARNRKALQWRAGGG